MFQQNGGMPGLDLPTHVSGLASGGRGGNQSNQNNSAAFLPFLAGPGATNISVTVGSAESNKQPDAEIRKFRKKYRQEILTAAMWGQFSLME